MKNKNKAKNSILIDSNKKINYALIIAIITFVIFANSFKNGYNMDDNLVTQNHPLTSKGLSTINEIFSSSYYKDNLGYNFGYRPMVHLSFAVEDAIFGESPAIGHFVNVLLYVFAVFLFYKLLLIWLGEEKKIIAILAALFFAVHPIHSEVVSSLKNRDEILAFIFAILSALSINQFVNSKKWWKLILAGLFFCLGMLSKKSIFPLAFVFPIAQFLLQKASLKEMIQITLILLIPTAIIGGEGDWFRTGLIFLVPAICIFSLIGVFHLIERKTQVVLLKKIILDNSVLILSMIAWIIVGIGIVKFSYISVIIAAILLSIVFYKNSTVGFVQIALLTFILSYQHLVTELLDYSLFFVMYFLLFDKHRIQKKSLYAIAIILLVLYTYLGIQLNFDFSYHSIVLQKVCFLFILFSLFRFKQILGFIYSLLIVLFFVYFNWIVMACSTSAFVIALLLNKTTKSIKFDYYVPVITFLTVLVISGFFGLKLFNNNVLKEANEIIKPIAKVQQFNTGIKEGRYLEYVENTLVAPHSKSETVATGLLVLAEYARLMIYPQELSFYYGFSKINTTSLNSFIVWISILFHLGLIGLALFKIKDNSVISIGILWYLACILLFSNWIELVAGMVGERLAFAASAGFSIFVASTLFWIKPSFNFLKPQKAELFIGVILVLFSVRTMSRNLDWKNPMILMSNDIKHLENSAQANNMLAMSFLDESLKNADLTNEMKIESRNKAIIHLQKAIEIYPYFFNYNFDLGRAYITINDNFSAKEAFLKAYKILPNSVIALEELTKTCFDLGQKEETEYYGNKYLAINPRNENIHELVAYICLLNNDYVKTYSYASRGLKYFPNNPNLNKMITDSSKFK